jgi:hypothetical protein
MSKSMLTNSSFVKTARSMNNPVGDPASQNQGQVIPANTTIIDFNNFQLALMSEIDASYGVPLANKLYNNIPSDYAIYVYYYNLVKEFEVKTKNTTILMLLKIIEHLLVGSINTFGIYSQNLMLQKDKLILQTKINDILSSKNVTNVEVTCNSGTINMTKTFTLATVFNAYILVYGLPEPGVGFDPIKVAFLASILKDAGVDPYK